MKEKSPLRVAAIVLLGVLIISVGVMALGSREINSFPSAASFRPSGVSAFYELLKRSGYRPVADQYVKPKLQEGDVVLAFYKGGLLYGDVNNQFSESADFGVASDEEDLAKTRQALTEFAESGGVVITLPTPIDFQGASERALAGPTEVVRFGSNRTARVSWPSADPGTLFLMPADNVRAPLWVARKGDTELAQVQRVGQGQLVTVSDCLLATNRFIDRDENAAVLMDVVRSVAEPGSRVVFAEAAFGNSVQPSLLGTLGAWAEAAWLQLVFLFFVVVYSLGKPFGLPEPTRRKQRGSRELVDAISDTYQRGRMTGVVLKSLKEDTERTLRRWFRHPREDADPTQPETLAIQQLDMALKRVDAAIEIGAPEGEAFKMYRKVESLMQEISEAGAHPMPRAR